MHCFGVACRARGGHANPKESPQTPFGGVTWWIFWPRSVRMTPVRPLPALIGSHMLTVGANLRVMHASEPVVAWHAQARSPVPTHAACIEDINSGVVYLYCLYQLHAYCTPAAALACQAGPAPRACAHDHQPRCTATHAYSACTTVQHELHVRT